MKAPQKLYSGKIKMRKTIENKTCNILIEIDNVWLNGEIEEAVETAKKELLKHQIQLNVSYRSIRDYNFKARDELDKREGQYELKEEMKGNIKKPDVMIIEPCINWEVSDQFKEIHDKLLDKQEPIKMYYCCEFPVRGFNLFHKGILTKEIIEKYLPKN